ncbi:MgtC/SapB family protein [Vagococcus bubulae]|nr:MgtC/SapB family protein [Vagococcus bubulae]
MLVMSLISGGLIGIERQWRKKIAGVRTMVLVSLGATIFVSISSMVSIDTSPTRIAAQVVSGIGFLAGGVILRDGFSVTGLNTAATLWCTAAVGAMIGAGFVKEGFLSAIIIMLVNIVIRFASHQLDQIADVYRPECDEELENSFLIVTSKNTSEVALRTEIIYQLDKYYLSFCHFLCQDLAGGMVQLQVEIEPSSNSELAIKEIITHLSKNQDVVEIYQLSKGELSW